MSVDELIAAHETRIENRPSGSNMEAFVAEELQVLLYQMIKKCSDATPSEIKQVTDVITNKIINDMIKTFSYHSRSSYVSSEFTQIESLMKKFPWLQDDFNIQKCIALCEWKGLQHGITIDENKMLQFQSLINCKQTINTIKNARADKHEQLKNDRPVGVPKKLFYRGATEEEINIFETHYKPVFDLDDKLKHIEREILYAFKDCEEKFAEKMESSLQKLNSLEEHPFS